MEPGDLPDGGEASAGQAGLPLQQQVHPPSDRNQIMGSLCLLYVDDSEHITPEEMIR